MSDRDWVAEPGMYSEISTILNGLLDDWALRSIAQTARSDLRVALGAVAFPAPDFSAATSLFVRDGLIAPENFALCADTMAGGEVLAVSNLSGDRSRAHDNAARLRCYAGRALRGWQGEYVGVFFVMDTKPRRWTTPELLRLRTYSRLVSSRIEIVRRFGTDSWGPSSGELIRRADQLASVGHTAEAQQLIALAYAADDIARMRDRTQDRMPS